MYHYSSMQETFLLKLERRCKFLGSLGFSSWSDELDVAGKSTQQQHQHTEFLHEQHEVWHQPLPTNGKQDVISTILRSLAGTVWLRDLL